MRWPASRHLLVVPATHARERQTRVPPRAEGLAADPPPVRPGRTSIMTLGPERWRRAAMLLAFLLVGGSSAAPGQGLVGVGFLSGQTTVQVFSIDPVTGDTTPILSTTTVSLSGAPIAFDPVTRRLFFQDVTDLWTVDLAHGTSSHIPLAYCCPFLQFDTRANLLLGLGFLPGQATVQVFSIDPVTGGTIPILSTSTVALCGASIGFDPATRRLFFGDGTDIWTADLALGTASHNPLASSCPALVFSGAPVAAVPLLGPKGLAALALALAIAGWHLGRAQRT
jgi:hypothetical protein